MKFTVEIEIDDACCEAIVTHGNNHEVICTDCVSGLFMRIKNYIQRRLEAEGLASE